jgi:hypothetical protein
MIHSKFFRFVALVVVPILMAAIVWGVSGRDSGQSATQPSTGTTPSIQIGVPTDPDVTDPTIPIPTIGTEEPTQPTEPEPTIGPEEIPDDGSGITPEEPKPTEPTEPKPTEPTEPKPTEPEKPTEPPVEEDDDDDEGGISIGGGTAPYDCGTEGHHCDGPETHAYILNLELKGCKYCGSHSCPSFYAVDEWGNTCYTPSECPEYDVHDDPVHYCQKCGKACGDGTNGTCVQFVSACHCPICGEHVDRRTCHTCKEE